MVIRSQRRHENRDERNQQTTLEKMKTTTRTPYDEQAAAFLADHGLTFTIEPHADPQPPAWLERPDEDHGDHFAVTLTREDDMDTTLTFDFWGSINDRNHGNTPSAYDVLACISSDFYCPDNFEDFCAEYGCDEDSRRAFALFERCADFAAKLRAFFTEDEAAALSEIQ